MQTFSAPGKLLLFGEHSAVFGYPAVGAALHRHLTIHVRPASRYSIRLSGSDRPVDPHALRAFAAHVEATLGPRSPAAFDVHSDLPIESGFGSSAALCTAIARWSIEEGATSGRRGPHSVVKETWALAHRLEHFFHGTPSGIDTGLSSLAGVQAFHFDRGPGRLPSPRRLDVPLPSMVVGSTPRERSTRELVASVRGLLESSERRVRPLLDRLGTLCGEAIAVLSTGRLQSPVQDADAEAPDVSATIAGLADRAHSTLRALGVSTPHTDMLLDVGRTNGALGGKLSGAGGGGAFYLVCPTDECATGVLERIRERLPTGGVAFTHLGSPR
ncbi:MAG: mevalonate kinase [Spirochaetales bacterium]|nr:mevalonate kinase [Spirochaetales bacterium]